MKTKLGSLSKNKLAKMCINFYSGSPSPKNKKQAWKSATRIIKKCKKRNKA